jgi:hypothetical protein
MQRMSVVLPQPLGPMSPVTVPPAISSDGMRTTSRPPRRTARPRMATATVMKVII